MHQQQPWVSSAVKRSVSRQQGGLGQRNTFVSLLAAREDIGVDTADQYPPHMPAPELPSRPASELVTPGMYRQACVHEFSDLWLYTMDVVERRSAQRGDVRRCGG